MKHNHLSGRGRKIAVLRRLSIRCNGWVYDILEGFHILYHPINGNE